jgi:hypothetical protein
MAIIGVRRTTAVRRRYLISLAVMGLIVSALGSTGLFAALSDSARTGQNQIDSAPLAGSAELKIQAGTVVGSPLTGFSSVDCPTAGFVDDLTTGGFNASNVTPGFATPNSYYCIQNAGSQTVHLFGNTDSVVDVEVGCTGDEVLLGDATCGGPLVGEGELSGAVLVRWIRADCLTLSEFSQSNPTIADNETVPVDLGTIVPGEIRCFALGASYPTTTPGAVVQQAQSDQVQWRFKFTGNVE